MQELLYTSAPRGLKPGSRGFCTVLSTQSMVAPLANTLEGLSGYRPVFAIGDKRVADNPVNYSHLKLNAAGKSLSVLSRVADYGLDYSQRTNKLAHHLVLDVNELPAAGPASVARLPGMLRQEWDGEPKIVPPKPLRKEPKAPIGVCQHWKDMTGDAGWAGVLAESFLSNPTRPIILLFEPGQDLLPLIDEAISLLPPERRWFVTFSTYFTGLPQGLSCLWRCIVAGSKEANESIRFVSALRIDLANTTLPKAAGGELVNTARTGVRTDLPKATRTVRTQERNEVAQLSEIPPIQFAEADSDDNSLLATNTEVRRESSNGNREQLTATPPRLTPSAYKFAKVQAQADTEEGVRKKPTWLSRVAKLCAFVAIVAAIAFSAREISNRFGNTSSNGDNHDKVTEKSLATAADKASERRTPNLVGHRTDSTVGVLNNSNSASTESGQSRQPSPPQLDAELSQPPPQPAINPTEGIPTSTTVPKVEPSATHRDVSTEKNTKSSAEVGATANKQDQTPVLELFENGRLKRQAQVFIDLDEAEFSGASLMLLMPRCSHPFMMKSSPSSPLSITESSGAKLKIGTFSLAKNDSYSVSFSARDIAETSANWLRFGAVRVRTAKSKIDLAFCKYDKLPAGQAREFVFKFQSKYLQDAFDKKIEIQCKRMRMVVSDDLTHDVLTFHKNPQNEQQIQHVFLENERDRLLLKDGKIFVAKGNAVNEFLVSINAEPNDYMPLKNKLITDVVNQYSIGGKMAWDELGIHLQAKVKEQEKKEDKDKDKMCKVFSDRFGEIVDKCSAADKARKLISNAIIHAEFSAALVNSSDKFDLNILRIGDLD